jgi:UDP-glucose 4-epimerase
VAILVSGASGFLGSRLIERLVADGQNVVAVARRPVPTTYRSNPQVSWIERDIAQDGLESIRLPDIDAVVHLAGATLGAGDDENLFLQANEQTTVRLCQALGGRIDRFVFASSQVVYGDARHLGVTENFSLQPDGSAYACSKLNSENWLRWFQKRHGGQYFALRFCGFIDGGGIVDYIIDRALAEEDTIELYSHGKVMRDYLASAEGVDVLIAALNYRGTPGFHPVNIGSGQAVSTHELAKLICDELRSSSRIELCSNPSPQGDFVFCIDQAKQLFGFHPSGLTDAVRRYARYRQTLAEARENDAKN